jgi:ribosome maturation factor RimP
MRRENALESNANAFDALIGRLVKVVYQDSGGEVKVRKGLLVVVNGDFLQIQTHGHTYMISRASISEIKTLGEVS